MVPLYLRLLQVQSLLWLSLSSSSFSSDEARVSIAKFNCADHCGKVKIPYPFGVGANCSYNAYYEIVCRHNDSFDHGTPFLKYYGLEITDIYWPKWYSSLDSPNSALGNEQTLTVRAPARNICGSESVGAHRFDLEGSPYRFSSFNDFMVVGCGGSALLKNKSGGILTGCASVCANDPAASNIETTNCFGSGCCRSPVGVDNGLVFYEVAVDYNTTATGSQTCTLAAGLIKSDSTSEKIEHLTTFPTMLDWSAAALIDNFTFDYTLDYDNFSCGNAYWGGKLCSCNYMYGGNPYLPSGCQGETNADVHSFLALSLSLSLSA